MHKVIFDTDPGIDDAMALLFLTLIAWPFRPSARDRNEEAANMIFKDDEHG